MHRNCNSWQFKQKSEYPLSVQPHSGYNIYGFQHFQPEVVNVFFSTFALPHIIPLDLVRLKILDGYHQKTQI